MVVMVEKGVKRFFIRFAPFLVTEFAFIQRVTSSQPVNNNLKVILRQNGIYFFQNLFYIILRIKYNANNVAVARHLFRHFTKFHFQ
jgi:hypothetical protein